MSVHVAIDQPTAPTLRGAAGNRITSDRSHRGFCTTTRPVDSIASMTSCTLALGDEAHGDAGVVAHKACFENGRLVELETSCADRR
jgi:hypothetical protein